MNKAIMRRVKRAAACIVCIGILVSSLENGETLVYAQGEDGGILSDVARLPDDAISGGQTESGIRNESSVAESESSESSGSVLEGAVLPEGDDETSVTTEVEDETSAPPESEGEASAPSETDSEALVSSEPEEVEPISPEIGDETSAPSESESEAPAPSESESVSAEEVSGANTAAETDMEGIDIDNFQAMQASADEVSERVLGAVEDTFSFSSGRDNNYGSKDELQLKNGQKYTYNKFDIDELTNMPAISSLTYHITQLRGTVNGQEITVSYSGDVNGTWEAAGGETEITYNNFTALSAEQIAWAKFEPKLVFTEGTLSYDVTQLLEQEIWSNGYFLIGLYDENRNIECAFYSKDASVSENQKPNLAIALSDVYNPNVDNMSVEQNREIQFQPGNTDENGEEVSVEAVSLPEGASFVNGTFAWNPNQAGVFYAVFKVTGKKGENKDACFFLRKITVTAPTEQTETIQIKVAEDTFTHTIDGNKIYNGQNLRIRKTAKYTAYTYGKFELTDALSTVKGLIKEVCLNMTLAGDSENVPLVVECILDNDWSEGEVTYNNFSKGQETTGEVPSIVNGTKGNSVQVDVTSLLEKRGWTDTKWSFRMRASDSADKDIDVSFLSKETAGEKAPCLSMVVTDQYIADTGNIEVMAGNEAAFQLPLKDEFGNDVSLQAVSLPEGAVFDSSKGEFKWRPEKEGIYTILIKVIIGQDNMGYLLRAIKVEDNRPQFTVKLGEEACAEREFEIRTGLTFALNVSAVNPDGSTAECTLSMPEGLSGVDYDSTTGNLKWTPAGTQKGEYTFGFRAANQDAAAECEIRIRVIGQHEYKEVIYPEADTYINTNSAAVARNYGNAPTLDLRGGFRWGYLRFNLEKLKEINGFIQDVSLRLTISKDASSPTGGETVKTAAILLLDDGWEEGDRNNVNIDPGSNMVCANNWPDYTNEKKYYDAMLFSKARDTRLVSVTQDVLDEYVKDGKISFCLRNLVSKEEASICTKEYEDSACWPALVISKTSDYNVVSAQSISEGDTLAVVVPIQKIDGTPLKISMLQMPETAIFDEQTGNFTWAVDYSSAGEHDIVYMASYEENGKTVMGFFTFKVTVADKAENWSVKGASNYYELKEKECLDIEFQASPIAVEVPARVELKSYYERSLTSKVTADELQMEINNASGAGGGIITLKAGTYHLNKCIELKSNVVLRGEGIGNTILSREDGEGKGGFLYSKGGICNVLVENLTLDGNFNPVDRRQDNENYGIWITDDNGSKNQIIGVDRVEIINSGMGFQTKGTYDLTVTDSAFHNNGIGPENYFHNVYIRRTYRVLFENCTMYDAENGNGANISHCSDVEFRNCQAYNNYYRGFRAADVNRIRFFGCVVHHNDMGNGILLNMETDKNNQVTSGGEVDSFSIENCTIYENGHGVDIEKNPTTNEGHGIFLHYAKNGYLINNTFSGGNKRGDFGEKGGNWKEVNDLVVWTAENLPKGAVLDSATGKLYWETGYEAAGRYVVQVKAKIGDVTTYKEVVINIENVTSPVIDEVELQKAFINKPFSLKVGASDPENGKLSFTAEGMPYGMTMKVLDGNAVSFAWTPQEYQTGRWNITLAATGVSTSKSTITVIVERGEKGEYSLEEAKEILESAVIGYLDGEYSYYAVEQLKAAIDTELQGEELTEAVKVFHNRVSTDKTGDLDKDGMRTARDLAMLLEGYRTGNSELDINGNQVIDLEDVVYLAHHVNLEDGRSIRTITLQADCAAHVSAENRYQSWHVQRTMNAKDGAYIGFDIEEGVLPGEILEATLILRAEDAGASGSVAVSVMKDDTGITSGNGITYANFSTRESEKIGDIAVQEGVLRVNITDVLTRERSGDGRISFMLSGADINFWSDDEYDEDKMPVLIIRTVMPKEKWQAYDAIIRDLDAVGLGSAAIEQNLPLVNQGSNGTNFVWKSLDTNLLKDDGTICRPGYNTSDMPVGLMVNANKEDVTVRRKYTVMIRKQDMAETAEAKLAYDKVEMDSEIQLLVNAYWEGKPDDFSATFIEYPTQYLNNVVKVREKTGAGIQAAIDEASEAGGGVVLLEEGIYVVDRNIQMRSNITLAGTGKNRTVLKQSENWIRTGTAEQMILCFNSPDGEPIHDVVIKDLALFGDRNSEVEVSGMFGGGANEKHHQRIMVQGISVKHFVAMGFEVKRADHIIMDKSDFIENGSGHSLYHNIYFLYNENILQSDLDLSRPVMGKSCKYTSATNVIAQHIVMRDGTTNAIQVDNMGAEYILFHDYVIEDFGGIGMWMPCEDYTDKFTYKEDPKFAPQHLILNKVKVTGTKCGGVWRIVEDAHILNSYFSNNRNDLELLKCKVHIENTVFDGPTKKAEELTDRSQLSDPVL